MCKSRQYLLLLDVSLFVFDVPLSDELLEVELRDLETDLLDLESDLVMALDTLLLSGDILHSKTYSNIPSRMMPVYCSHIGTVRGSLPDHTNVYTRSIAIFATFHADLTHSSHSCERASITFTTCQPCFYSQGPEIELPSGLRRQESLASLKQLFSCAGVEYADCHFSPTFGLRVHSRVFAGICLTASNGSS